jgi:hypothetical protein
MREETFDWVDAPVFEGFPGSGKGERRSMKSCEGDIHPHENGSLSKQRSCGRSIL